MPYKQKNPFNGPANFRNPKNKGTSNFNALEFQMPDLSQIYNKTADGDSKTVDVTNESTTGTSDEGKVGKDTPVKSSTDITLENAKKGDEPTYKDRVAADKKKRKELNQDIREARRMKKDRGNILTDEQRQEASDAFSSLKGKRKFDRSARRDNISVEQAIMNEFKAEKEREKKQKEEEEKLYNERKDDPYYQNLDIGPNLGNKGMQMKQVNRKGKGFPMVNPATQVDQMGNPIPQPPAKGTMANGGRPLNSNVLVNDPTNYQDPSKISAQSNDQAMKMNNIAHSAGTPTPQYNPYNNEMTGMAFNDKLRAASAAGDLDDSPEFKAEVDAAPAMVKGRKPIKGYVYIRKANRNTSKSKDPLQEEKDNNPYKLNKPIPKKPGTSMYGDHAHTKVTKKNLKATERDDAAHMDYLKRDINYDAKHHGSKKQMLDDEKHISKLAGDLKYDSKHRGRKYDNV